MESTKYRGPTAPFWEIRGESADHPTADTMAKPPSKAMVGSAEERGRPTRKESQAKKRATWALGMKASSQKEGKEKLGNEGPKKQSRAEASQVGGFWT